MISIYIHTHIYAALCLLLSAHKVGFQGSKAPDGRRERSRRASEEDIFEGQRAASLSGLAFFGFRVSGLGDMRCGLRIWG